MKKLYTRFTKLVFRFDQEIEDTGIQKHPYHLNYESGVYREDDLVKIIRGAMPHFALTPDEYSRLKDQDEIDEMYRLAFSRISKAKKEKRGIMASFCCSCCCRPFIGLRDWSPR